MEWINSATSCTSALQGRRVGQSVSLSPLVDRRYPVHRSRNIAGTAVRLSAIHVVLPRSSMQPSQLEDFTRMKRTPHTNTRVVQLQIGQLVVDASFEHGVEFVHGLGRGGVLPYGATRVRANPYRGHRGEGGDEPEKYLASG